MEFFRQLKLDQILKIMILQNQELASKTRAVTNDELSSDKHICIFQQYRWPNPRWHLQEHVRDLVSEITSIKADFARYRAMVYAQDEIEDAEITACRGQQDDRHVSPHSPTSTNSAYNHKERVSQKAGRRQRHGHAGSPSIRYVRFGAPAA